MLAFPLHIGVVSIALPGRPDILPGLVVAHAAIALLLPGGVPMLLRLCMLVGLVEDCSAIAPQPDGNDSIHQQRQHYLGDRMSCWGQGALRFQHQQPPKQEE